MLADIYDFSLRDAPTKCWEYLANKNRYLTGFPTWLFHIRKTKYLIDTWWFEKWPDICMIQEKGAVA